MRVVGYIEPAEAPKKAELEKAPAVKKTAAKTAPKAAQKGKKA